MEVDSLPYDDEAGNAYAKEHPEHDFKNRIGYEYVYSLYAKNLANHFGNLYVTQRPKQAEEDAEDDTEQMALEENGESTGTREGIRDNAICFRGNPIANLPTQRIFAYVSHSVTPPLGLEWVNDTNVVLVWKTTSEAKDAYQSMREAGTLDMEEDDEGFVPARPIPQTLAPMELRLEKALGKTTLEQEQIWMRWARTDDVKEKGGRNKSKFYEKYGENAGKEGQNVFSSSRRSNKRKRDDPDEDLKRKLDAELDGFAEGDETIRRRSISPRRGRSASPPRRDRDRRSNGRRRHGDYEYDRDLKSRLGPQGGTREWDVGKEWQTDEFGRSSFGRHDRSTIGTDEGHERRGDGRGHRRDRREGGGGRKRDGARPAVTKEELDAELDAFLEA